MQGTDYPIKSNRYIVNFFEKFKDVEFIRGCCCTNSEDNYFRSRCYMYWLYNNYNKFTFFKKECNRLSRDFKLEFRNGCATGDGIKHDVYWGSAQWAITGVLAHCFIDFYDSYPKYNKWYYHAFPADELYFTTLAMNSPYKERLYAKGPEIEKKD